MNNPELLNDLLKALLETFYMVGISLTLAIVLGIPLGLLLYITEKGLFAENKLVNLVGGFVINVIRSTPYVILLVLLLPVTQRVIGTTVGPFAASVSLSVAAIAFYARLVQSAIWEVDRGVIEAAHAMGATPRMIITDVLLPESFPGLMRGMTVTAVSLIGFSAMAGIVGGGGVGDLAIRFGYYRYETDVMLVTVVVLIILVQCVQSFGDYLAKRGQR
ncbi:methionine ABC transporter permease [Heliophilum fasciatum]|uniref:D-methionine transport system permease protein n=1 Tax=Heliophilum fasciatum TaxID=35700 RepID=A0A4R2RYM8_9FIRM|nr:methionine ABC transporter permease [Heliophilum fasciatum]MCW2276826.1 D-methionine transport system permease protein [Heliophilum fasciatum]TCP68713.1 D-methionine transport system permease protein [Heliophilum fasciatum]